MRNKVVPDFQSEHPVGSKAWNREYAAAYRKTATGRMAKAKSLLKQLHGLTAGKYEQLYERQRGSCAICARAIVRSYTAEKQGKRGPRPGGAFINHDHACCGGSRSCGKCVRGLLCHKCNIGLATFRDSPELLRAAIEYLSVWRCNRRLQAASSHSVLP